MLLHQIVHGFDTSRAAVLTVNNVNVIDPPGIERLAAAFDTFRTHIHIRFATQIGNFGVPQIQKMIGRGKCCSRVLNTDVIKFSEFRPPQKGNARQTMRVQ